MISAVACYYRLLWFLISGGHKTGHTRRARVVQLGTRRLRRRLYQPARYFQFFLKFSGYEKLYAATFRPRN
jgi:hypothetical protein